MSENIMQTSDADFSADVLEADKPVLVDYWAIILQGPHHSAQ